MFFSSFLFLSFFFFSFFVCFFFFRIFSNHFWNLNFFLFFFWNVECGNAGLTLDLAHRYTLMKFMNSACVLRYDSAVMWSHLPGWFDLLLVNLLSILGSFWSDPEIFGKILERCVDGRCWLPSEGIHAGGFRLRMPTPSVECATSWWWILRSQAQSLGFDYFMA